MSSHPPDTFVVGGACGTLRCTRIFSGIRPLCCWYPIPSHMTKGLLTCTAQHYCWLRWLPDILQFLVGHFLPVQYFCCCQCLDFFSLCDIFMNGACSEFSPHPTFVADGALSSFSPHPTFVADDYLSEFSPCPTCPSYRSYKLHWISNYNARHGTVSTNTIASRHCCLDLCSFVLARWELLPTWKYGSDKLFCHSATAVAYSHGKRYQKLWSNFTLRYNFTPRGARCATLFPYVRNYCDRYTLHLHHQKKLNYGKEIKLNRGSRTQGRSKNYEILMMYFQIWRSQIYSRSTKGGKLYPWSHTLRQISEGWYKSGWNGDRLHYLYSFSHFSLL